MKYIWKYFEFAMLKMYSKFYFCDLWRQFRRFFISNVSLLTWGCRFTIWYDIWQEKLERPLWDTHTHTCRRVVLMFCSLRDSVVDWKGAKEGTERKNFFRRRTLSQKSLESSWSALLLLFTDAWKMFRKERHAICVARFYFVLLFEYKGHNKHFRFTNPHLKMIVKGNGTFPTFSSPLFSTHILHSYSEKKMTLTTGFWEKDWRIN